MGNSVRHTFGHMCGGQASKEAHDNESERPVKKSKGGKKKGKKSKKNKKLKNGKLDGIKDGEVPGGEEGNGQPLHKEEDEKAVESTDGLAVEEKADVREDGSLHHTDETIQALALTTEELTPIEKEETVVEVSPNVPESEQSFLTTATDGSSEIETHLSGSAVEYNNISDSDDIAFGGGVEDDGVKGSLLDATAILPVEPEVLGIEYPDEVFGKAFNIHKGVVEDANRFKVALQQFHSAVDGKSKCRDFTQLWDSYKELFDIGGGDCPNASETVDSRIFADNIDAIINTGHTLQQNIDDAKPAFEQCAKEAENIDAIECTKEKMLGDQMLDAGEFSTPVRYRRNMKELIKCEQQINRIEVEANEILNCIKTQLNDKASVEPSEGRAEDVSPLEESIILPCEVNDQETANDILLKLDDSNMPNENNEERKADLSATNEDVSSPDDISDELIYGKNSEYDMVEVESISQPSVDNERNQNTVSFKVSNEISPSIPLHDENCVALEGSPASTDSCNVDDICNTHSHPQVHLDEADTQTPFSLNIEISDERNSIVKDDFKVSIESDEEIVLDVAEELQCEPELPIGDVENYDIQHDKEVSGDSDSTNAVSKGEAGKLLLEAEIENEDKSRNVPSLTDSSADFLDDLNIDENAGSKINLEPASVEESHEEKTIARLSDTTEKLSDIENDFVNLPIEERNESVVITETTSTIVTIEDIEISSCDDDARVTDARTDGDILESGNVGISINSPEMFDSNEKLTNPSDEFAVSLHGSNEIAEPNESNSISCDKEDYSNTTKESNVDNDEGSAGEIDEDIVLPVSIGEEQCENEELSDFEELTDDIKSIESGEVLLKTSDTESEDMTILINGDIEIAACKGDDHWHKENINAVLNNAVTSASSANNEPCPTALENKISTEQISCASDASRSEITEKTDVQGEATSPFQEVNPSKKEEEEEVNPSTKEELDAALIVIGEAINSNSNVEDEFVDLLCTSLSRVLSEEKPILDKSESSNQNTQAEHRDEDKEEETESDEDRSGDAGHLVGSHSSSPPDVNSKMATEQSIFVPVDNMHSPHTFSHTILVKSENDISFKKEEDVSRGKPTIKTETVDVSLDESHGSFHDNSDSEDSVDDRVQTFVIKSISENKEGYDKLTSPADSELAEEEEACTLDYGNYVFVDPTTGDISVMRNRSKSLDSLVSMTSNRSSISRFGSFEFVTDFEINIAEKNQELMKVT